MRTLALVSSTAVALCFAGVAVMADPVDQPNHTSPAPGTSNDAVSATKDVAGHMVGDISAEMTTTLKGFATAAAESDMYEVEAGKIAGRRSKNQEVDKFAAEMVKAHSQTTRQLKSLLSKANPDIVPPSHLDSRHQAMIDELRGAADADFNHRYVMQQISAHKEALILMRGYAKDGDDPSVKEFAAKTTPVVQEHLDMAQHMQSVGM